MVYTDYKKLIRFIGMMRSGNHGVLNWVIDSFDSIHFRNHLYFKHRHKHLPLFSSPQILKQEPEVVIYSIETGRLDLVKSDKKIRDIDITVILMRDPFNLWASTYKIGQHPKAKRHFQYKGDLVKRYVEDWKIYARDYLGKTNLLSDSSEKFYILFNKWFVDEGYRRGILEKLGADRLDTAHNKMIQTKKVINGLPMKSPSSSFDGDKYKEDATQMDILNRWKHVIDTEQFDIVMGDKELMELSYEIFGNIVA
jgi:hypothetical protein